MTADSLFETTSIPGHLAPTPERLERLLSKQTLEELYEVEEQPFARGKYATVKKCRERSSGRQWAAKFLRKRRRAQGGLRAEALHEVAVLDAAAHCPRLVSLHQVFETNTEMVLVLELAPGGELQMILDRDEVPEERQVARLLKQILDGIAFLHSLNVAHLDIKPQNLVLTGEYPDCDVKLCDFGISRYINGTDVREILGTPDYVAPEVLNYEPISLATDMWSVGVLLYVLLTGCSPFGGDTKQETFCNIGRCRLDFPDDLFEDVSEEARDLMRKLMVKDPNERLTATECLQHPWFNMFEQPSAPLASAACPTSDDKPAADSSTMPSQEDSPSKMPPMIADSPTSSTMTTSMPSSSSTPKSANEKQRSSTTGPCHAPESPTKSISNGSRIISSHTEKLYSATKSSAKPIRFGLSPDRRDTFRRNMDSLARKFSGTEIVIIESTSSSASSSSSTTITTTSNSTAVIQQRRATATHTMPASGEVFKCTPVFILGEAEPHCSDSNSDTVSEISTDSSSDRSSIYSDDSLDFILYGKSQARANFPFAATDASADRWEQRHRQHHRTRVWPRECSGVVSKALSRFTSENASPNATKIAKISIPPTATALRANKTGLEALRERGGNLVVIREPVRAGRYTRYSEVQCESVQARIRRFQVHEAS